MDQPSPLILLHENGYKALAEKHRGIVGVEYRPVSRRQKCVWCANDATQEAVQSVQNQTVISRCCDDPKCICLSTEMCERMTA